MQRDSGSHLWVHALNETKILLITKGAINLRKKLGKGEFRPINAPKNALRCGPRHVRAQRNLSRQFNLICPVQSCSKKFFALAHPQIKSIVCYPVPTEGRFAIVTDVRRDAV